MASPADTIRFVEIMAGRYVRASRGAHRRDSTGIAHAIRASTYRQAIAEALGVEARELTPSQIRAIHEQATS